ncbi:MAG: hypothetical protein HOQ05_04665 [Corynebacteriales bacterium]|nr:hypothetical protein [Mycobacteriales bacterium]
MTKRNTSLRSRLPHGDSGRAVIEFLGIGVGIMVPLLYIGMVFFTIERHNFAIAAAAREAGRAYAQASDEKTGKARAERAVQLALEDHGLAEVNHRLAYGPPNTNCSANMQEGAATIEPGARFAICVIITMDYPAVPGFIERAHNVATAKYIVHIGTTQERPGA